MIGQRVVVVAEGDSLSAGKYPDENLNSIEPSPPPNPQPRPARTPVQSGKNQHETSHPASRSFFLINIHQCPHRSLIILSLQLLSPLVIDANLATARELSGRDPVPLVFPDWQYQH